MAAMYYTVLAASGGWVDGKRAVIGSLIPLDEVVARYEVDAGTVAPTGQTVPTPPALPAIVGSDLVTFRRGSQDRPLAASALETFVARTGGAVAASIAGALGALVGDAPSDSDTLGEIAHRIDAKASRAEVAASIAAALSNTVPSFDFKADLGDARNSVYVPAVLGV